MRRTQVVTSDIGNYFYLATTSRRLTSAPLCEVEHCCRGSTVEWRRNWIHTVLSSFHYSKRILMKRKTAGKSLPCRFHGVAQNGLTWHSVLALLAFHSEKTWLPLPWVETGLRMESTCTAGGRQKCIVWALMPQMHKFTFLILSAVYFSFIQHRSQYRLKFGIDSSVLRLSPPEFCLFVKVRLLSRPPQELNLHLPVREQRKHTYVVKIPGCLTNTWKQTRVHGVTWPFPINKHVVIGNLTGFVAAADQTHMSPSVCPTCCSSGVHSLCTFLFVQVTLFVDVQTKR